MADLVHVRRPEDFPESVHQSLQALRLIARQAKSKDDPGLRKATPDELALAEVLRKPNDCVAHSTRTGLPCTRARIVGTSVCPTHGGQAKRVRQALRRRLAEAAPHLIESMILTAQQRENLSAGVKAGSDLLDRAGIGALVQAKVRASRQQQATGTQVVVNIGFLG
jgi:hypothetical protein